MSNSGSLVVLDKKSEGDGTTAPGGGSSGQTGTTSTVGVAQANAQADAHESQDDSDDDFFVGGVSAGGGTTTGATAGSGQGVAGVPPLGETESAEIVSGSAVTVLDKSSGGNVTVTSPSLSMGLATGTLGLSNQVAPSDVVQVQGTQPQVGKTLEILEQVPGTGITQVHPVSDGEPCPGCGTTEHGLPSNVQLQRLQRVGPAARLKPLGVDLHGGPPAPTGQGGQRLRPLPGPSGLVDSTGMFSGTGPHQPGELGPAMPCMGSEPGCGGKGKYSLLPLGVDKQIPVKYPEVGRCRSDCGKEPKLPDLPVHREVFLTGYLDRFFPNQWRTNHA